MTSNCIVTDNLLDLFKLWIVLRLQVIDPGHNLAIAEAAVRPSEAQGERVDRVEGDRSDRVVIERTHRHPTLLCEPALITVDGGRARIGLLHVLHGEGLTRRWLHLTGLELIDDDFVYRTADEAGYIAEVSREANL